jgi:hypothetical protein
MKMGQQRKEDIHSKNISSFHTHAWLIVPLDLTSKTQGQRQNYEFLDSDCRILNEVESRAIEKVTYP